jgi:4-amino-4-deoxy-L-arabinose transferase-like glycosyltransferase
MSSTLLDPPASPAPGGPPGVPAPRRARQRMAGVRDAHAIAALVACFAALTALTWRRWGVPEIDAGAELTTADAIKHGAMAYRDVRYYYGPLGLYSLALAFKLFGASFTTAFAFGLAQTAAIVAAFYTLARRWLPPLTAGLAGAVVLAVGFSGTAFNFVLPHTSSATFGLLAVLLMLLALAHSRLLWAGAMAGLVGLTRPEFEAVALAALAAHVAATWRTSNAKDAAGAAWRLALGAVAIPVVVLGWFAWRAGLSTLVTENLWPVRFIHVGARTESNWMPFTLSSLVGLTLRAAVYLGLLTALVKSAQAWNEQREANRGSGLGRGPQAGPGMADPSQFPALRLPVSGWIAAAWPLAAAGLAIALVDGLMRASGVLAMQRTAIELEACHLMLGMSWLPALGLAAAVLAAVRLVRRAPSPLGGSWPVDLALIVVAAGLGLRAYNAFTTEGSYAPYYAAPLVLLLAILHTRVAERRPRGSGAAIGALALVAVGLATYALGGLYVHDDTPVHTPRGIFMTTAAAAPALERAVRTIDASTHPGEPILAAPVDGGLYFMSDRTSALYELSLLPGLLAGPAEERAAIARLRREHVTLAVLGARDFSAWGAPTFGIDYASLLGDYLRKAATSTTTIGALSNPVGGTNPSHGFTVMRLG